MSNVKNNDRRPAEAGYYNTIDSVGNEYTTWFDGTHWKPRSGHPIEYWNDTSESTISQPEQPIIEEGKDKKYWRDRWFYIIGHNPGRSVNHIEDLIEEMMNYYSPSPSQEAIEVLDWLLKENHPDTHQLWAHRILMTDGDFYFAGDEDGDQPMNGKDLYQLYTEHKNDPK